MNSMMDNIKKHLVTIIQFAKSPEGDSIKTRLSPALNINQRLTLHKAMTQRAFQQAFYSQSDKVTLAVQGNYHNTFFKSLHDNVVKDSELKIKNTLYALERQQGDDLGQKMLFAAQYELQSNDTECFVILIGSDCPFISSDYLNAAIEELAKFPVVIGPATDGGYVLLGMRKIIPSLFQNIPWGSENVFEKTCTALQEEGIVYKALDVLSDIDRPEDLALLDQFSEENDYFKDFFKSL